MNTFGQLFKITTFGESHGTALGVVIDGLPAGFEIDIENVKNELARRKPGQSKITTQRKENEEIEILSGIFEGKSTGHPITIVIRNKDQRSKNYDNLKEVFRPSHADLTYHQKYGIRDHRGGGRSSGRETLARVIAGAIAKQYLKEKCGTDFFAYTKQVADSIAKNIDFNFIEKNDLRTADPEIADEMLKYVEKIAAEGNSIGGIIECTIINPAKNLGEPTFGKIKSRLSDAMLTIGAVLGFEYGAGFDVTKLTGETYNESLKIEKLKSGKELKIISENNSYGGILGGISTGEDIVFRVAVKPTSSIYKKQKTVNTQGNEVDFKIEGRHDPCILPRIVPVIESMAAIVLLDLYLLNKAKK